jgi:hypothetical protein
MLKKVAMTTAKGAYDFIIGAYRFASNLYDFIENLFYSAFSLVRMLILMAVEAVFMPAIFYYSANSLIGIAGTNHWLGSWIIETSKKAVIGLLTWGEQLPLIGVMFTPAVLPWVIYLGIGKLMYSHFKQMWSEQNKIIKQQTKHLDPAEQPKGIAYWGKYVEIFSSPAEKEKAYAMRLLLSVCVPTFLFLFRSFSGVNPATALIHSGVFSLLANLLPYGLIGIAVEGGNFAVGLMQRWQRVPLQPEPEPQRPIVNNNNASQQLLQQLEQQQAQPQLQARQQALAPARADSVVLRPHNRPRTQNPAPVLPEELVAGNQIPVEQHQQPKKRRRARR